MCPMSKLSENCFLIEFVSIFISVWKLKATLVYNYSNMGKMSVEMALLCCSLRINDIHTDMFHTDMLVPLCIKREKRTYVVVHKYAHVFVAVICTRFFPLNHNTLFAVDCRLTHRMFWLKFVTVQKAVSSEFDFLLLLFFVNFHCFGFEPNPCVCVCVCYILVCRMLIHSINKWHYEENNVLLTVRECQKFEINWNSSVLFYFIFTAIRKIGIISWLVTMK